MNATNQSEAVSQTDAPSTGRLMALDALRGFDMFWIVGAEFLVQALRKLGDFGPTRLLADQLEHVPWAGFHFEDLIFPMFVFIVGVSLVFSLRRTVERQGRAEAVRRILRRSILLYLIGVFYYGGFSTPFAGIRLLGVLQRIALSYLVAALLFCFLRPRALAAVTVGILVGYWALMTFVPVPGHGAGDFTEGRNLANYVDAQFLPFRKWDGDHDPEGLLSTLPAIANCLLGVFAGLLLQRADRSDRQKVALLAAAGVASVTLGWLWHLQFPVIKKLWTSSFVLVACGYSALLLAAFYQVVEIWRLRGWAQPFVWIGVNPITIYLLFEFVDLKALSARFLGGDLIAYFGRYGELLQALILLALVFGFVRFLYRRKVFLRL